MKDKNIRRIDVPEDVWANLIRLWTESTHSSDEIRTLLRKIGVRENECSALGPNHTLSCLSCPLKE